MRTMRSHRLLLLSLSSTIALLAAAPATATDVGVDVTSSFTFSPKVRTIAVGDTVTWNWQSDGHTTTSGKNQPESWNSRLRDSGATFAHTFTHPGRYQYICNPPESIGMKGTIVVGTDTVKKTLAGRPKAKPRGSTVTVSFKLSEPAVVTYKLKGRSKKTVKKGRLKTGKHSFKVKHLKAGRYHATLSLSDDFDNASSSKGSFRIK
jgi:plastocyanin